MRDGRVLTSVEPAADGGNDDLESEQTAHAKEHGAFLLVNGVYPDNVDDGAGGEENRGADGLEQEELRALLWDGDVSSSF